ncbi:hypothetical protein HU200_013841 [Digitaria exilis]|uniref:Uncharacterized protein n=1 Tax=Digitaria exilis TaxID=1010633 RepID=A0A835KKR3_9POAL|nr:hypothetical protein HU200_013841 [Digitaria exilis]
MHPVSVSLQPFTATPASILIPRSTALRNSLDFAELRRAGMSSGNRAMNSIPNPTLVLEISRKDFTVGDKDAIVIVDHGSRRQESNLMLNHFVEMFRTRTGYNIVEPAHMVLLISLAFLCFPFFFSEKWNLLIY